MAIDRAWDHGVSIVATTPDFVAGFRFVGNHGITAEADDLFLTIDFDQQWSVEGELFLRTGIAFLLPDGFAGIAVKGNDEGVSGSIAAKE